MILIREVSNGTPKLIFLSDKGGITNTTTIAELLVLTSQWYEVGGAGGAGGTIIRQDFIATDAQTNFVCANTLTTPAVYIEGLLIDADEYTVLNNSVVQFNTGITLGTEVSIITSVPTPSDSIQSERAVATAGQTNFPTTFEMISAVVYVNGVLQDNNYVVTSNLVTFNNGLVEGDIVKIFASSPVVSATLAPFEVDYTANLGQTVFTATYTPGTVQVFVNGLKLRDTDFTASNGTDVTIPLAELGDWVQIIDYRA
jgi:hypothetical protein